MIGGLRICPEAFGERGSLLSAPGDVVIACGAVAAVWL